MCSGFKIANFKLLQKACTSLIWIDNFNPTFDLPSDMNNRYVFWSQYCFFVVVVVVFTEDQ